MTRDAFIELANENEFDHVAVDLANLKVDLLPDEDWNHLARFLFDIDDEIADQLMPRYLVGAVARVITPGCQLRQTPVLQGGQGIGKTELGRALFGHDFYDDGLTPAAIHVLGDPEQVPAVGQHRQLPLRDDPAWRRQVAGGSRGGGQVLHLGSGLRRVPQWDPVLEHR